jgi:regulator of sigma E protease
LSWLLNSVGPWVLVLFGLSLLIIVHEGGHFLAAKATGMRAESANLFFGPKLISTRRGETDYAIRAIPLGGYVKITGMNPDEVRDLPPEVQKRAYYAQPVWKRIVVIGAGPAMNILLAFLILFGVAFGLQKGTFLKVGTVQPNTPAQQILQKGDQLISMDGVHPRGDDLEQRATRFQNVVNSHRCRGQSTDHCRATAPVRVVVKRNGRVMTVSARPFYDPAVNRFRLGFGFAQGGLVAVNPSPPEAAKRAFDEMWLVTRKTAGVIGGIFESKQRKQLSGVVGVSVVAQQAIGFGAREALILLALVSLSVALINLFPILPLDGGHIFWSLVEKVRGRPVSFRIMERASAVGILLVIMLALIGLQNDVGRLTGNGFHVH